MRSYWVARDEHFDIAANALSVHARIALDVHASDFSFPDNLPASVFPTRHPTPSASAKR